MKLRTDETHLTGRRYNAVIKVAMARFGAKISSINKPPVYFPRVIVTNAKATG